MKSSTLIILLLLFGLFYSCNKQSENKKTEFVESKLFGQVKSMKIITFENDTLKSREFKIFRKDGIIERNETHFEPNLSSTVILYEYDSKDRLESELIISDGDTTFTYSYFYNNLGLIKKEEFYEKKLYSATDYKLNSSRKVIEKKFKYENTEGLRTFKFYYPDSLTTITKEFVSGNTDKTTELKIYAQENKKILLKNYAFPKSESKEISYHNISGNLTKKEKYYNGKLTETKRYKYQLDFNKNWVKSESQLIRKERIIEYYKK